MRYRYLIYRLYTWRLEKNDDTPEATVIFTMSVVHLIQLMTLLAIIPIPAAFHFTKLTQYCIVIGFMVLYYLLVYNKKKWLSYIDEFKNETPEQRRKGTIFVQLFTIGSIILFFAVLVIIITISEYKKLPGV